MGGNNSIIISRQKLDPKKFTRKTELNMACFSNITYKAMPKSLSKITVFFKRTDIPYTEERAKQWCEDLNALGFYVTYGGIKKCKSRYGEREYMFFDIPVEAKKITKRLHLTSILVLVRYLQEDGINELPQIYFDCLEAVPNADKFKVLQMIHWFIPQIGYLNTNHTLTQHENCFIHPRTKKEIFSLMEKSKYSIFDAEYTSLNQFWGAEGMKVPYDTVKKLTKEKEYEKLYQSINKQ